MVSFYDRFHYLSVLCQRLSLHKHIQNRCPWMEKPLVSSVFCEHCTFIITTVSVSYLWVTSQNNFSIFVHDELITITHT